MGENTNVSVTSGNTEGKVHEISKGEAVGITALAAVGAFSIVKSAIKKFKAWNLERAQKKLIQMQQAQAATAQQQAQPQQTPAK